jgi:hypothetical protein
MSAQIIEQAEALAPEETSDLPTDQQQLTQSELIADLAAVDTLSEVPPQEDDLPEKYRGKSIPEIVAMHQQAEKLIGSQGSEVGELRKVVDTYISAQTAAQSQIPEESEEEIDFFEDPKGAVSQAIEQHPEVRQARQAAQDMKRSSSLQQLQTKHPDMQTVLNAPAFSEWVKGSPVRMELYQRADRDFDFNAADELVSNFKERAQLAQQTVQTETVARQQAVRQASTGSASGSGNAGSKRVYRRADIIKLMKNDPDRYEALSPEIMLAYQEGRVK